MLHHDEVGDVDLVWGKPGTGKSDGYGLSKLIEFHPEVVDSLQEILNRIHAVSRSDNGVHLESDTHQASVRLTWDKERNAWLLTAFKKKTPSSVDKTMDTGDNRKDPRGDTALSWHDSVSSEGKDTESFEDTKTKEDSAVEVPTQQAEAVDPRIGNINDGVITISQNEIGELSSLSEDGRRMVEHVNSSVGKTYEETGVNGGRTTFC